MLLSNVESNTAKHHFVVVTILSTCRFKNGRHIPSKEFELETKNVRNIIKHFFSRANASTLELINIIRYFTKVLQCILKGVLLFIFIKVEGMVF